ncbi:MAG: hypothetical protein BWY79_00523 [Actinobacteria bacterium ADurb.Bin444]|nr:MAG: hypothetical protein BWY79_00523 [Actinobacteria bacterium ADurb.Bin444]
MSPDMMRTRHRPQDPVPPQGATISNPASMAARMMLVPWATPSTQRSPGWKIRVWEAVGGVDMDKELGTPAAGVSI